MKRTSVVRNIPKDVVHRVRHKLLGGHLRGRGPRVHNGRRHFQDLPATLAERFTLYQGYNYHKQFFDFIGVDEHGRVHLRYNQAESQ
jgi:hypothetical protein